MCKNKLCSFSPDEDGVMILKTLVKCIYCVNIYIIIKNEMARIHLLFYVVLQMHVSTKTVLLSLFIFFYYNVLILLLFINVFVILCTLLLGGYYI